MTIAIVVLQVASASAKTLVVSKGVNCWPQVAGPLYPTIQAAVNAMPTAGTAVNTVIVCPGIYPEQVVITKNITITGALRDGTDPESQNGNSAEARIVVPPGGLVALPFGSGFIAAQIVAQNIADLNLTNLTIDGNGGGCPLDPAGQPVRSAGIALLNVGLPGTSYDATISKNNIRSQVGKKSDGSRCYADAGQGEGVIAEDSWFTLDSNSIHGIDLSPVHQIRGISRIKSNSLGLGFYGVWLSNVSLTAANNAGSTVSLNDIQGFSAGIHLDASSNVLVTQNNISNWTGAGIWLSHGSSDNDLISNRIADAWYGIDLGGAGDGLGGHARNTVRSNTITRSARAAIVDVFSHGSNQISSNTISDAPIGVFYMSTVDDVFVPNSFFNVTVLITTGTSLP